MKNNSHQWTNALGKAICLVYRHHIFSSIVAIKIAYEAMRVPSEYCNRLGESAITFNVLLKSFRYSIMIFKMALSKSNNHRLHTWTNPFSRSIANIKYKTEKNEIKIKTNKIINSVNLVGIWFTGTSHIFTQMMDWLDDATPKIVFNCCTISRQAANKQLYCIPLPITSYHSDKRIS